MLFEQSGYHFSYPCWTCHRDGINAILREVDKYFLQMKNHRKSRLCARSAVREMTSEKLQIHVTTLFQTPWW
ncbi:unnamed protein product [Dicrocoelium dendriticum]|nr:unnamed protein product [Dicrocoelium dendriticum]